MLHSLYVKNFALIDDVEVTFEQGLNVVTGETGAGKSMLIDALQVALGSRASVDFIRAGREKASVQATFEISQLPWIKKRMIDLGFDEDDLFIMSRELSRNGKNICRVNGRLVNLSVYKELGSGLVDMLGQYEQQTLLNQDKHRVVLDSLGGQELLSQASKVKEIYSHWRRAQQELEELEQNAREIARRLEMLTYQVQEIKKAELAEDEEELLMGERRLLMNSEKISRLSEEIYSNLYGGELGVSAAVDSVAKALAALQDLAEIDSNMSPFLETLESALYQLEDVAREVSSYRDEVEYNPERLDEIEHRLSLIKQLKYKYGSSIQEILEYQENALDEITTLNNSTEKAQSLKQDIKALEKEWYQEAKILTKLRKNNAKNLEQLAAKELRYLEMGSMDFKVGISEKGDVNPYGLEDIEFLIAPNPGEPLRPLQKIASGGELSRIMLALKVILSGVDEVPTLIFDEIDTGVGGKALQAIGEKLAQVGQHRQVICVTHGPQVACFADNHYLISKSVVEGHAQTSVQRLDPEERVEELARMLAGREITDVVKNHARQMLKMSASYKN